MLGIHLPENFYSPYLARSPSEFWRRWHVTLSTWIRDYIYIPLGGSSGGLLRTAFVVVVTMSISGLWHGAALTFIIWGLYHGVLLVAERLSKRAGLPLFESALALPLMFALTVIGWMVFRAESIDSLITMMKMLAGFGRAATAQVPLPAVVLGLGSCMLLQVFGYSELDGKSERQGVSLGQRSVAYWNAYVLRDPSLRVGLSGAGIAVVIVAALALRAGDTSSRFIYFQF